MSSVACELWEVRLANGETGADIDRHLAECEDCRTLAADLRDNSLALSAMRQDVMPERRIAPKRWPYIAATLAAAAVLTLMLWPGAESSIAPVREPLPIAVTTELPPPAPEKPNPPVRRAAFRPKPQRAPEAEPLLVKMLTDDPDVVIYWLIDAEKDADKEANKGE